ADVVADVHAEDYTDHLRWGRWERLHTADEVKRLLVERARAGALCNTAGSDATLAVEAERQLYGAVLVASLRSLRIALVALDYTVHLSYPVRDGVRVADVDLALFRCGRNDGLLGLGCLRRGRHRGGQLVISGLDLFWPRFRRQCRHRDLGILGGQQVRLLLFDFGDLADFLRLLLDLFGRLWSGLGLHLLGPRRRLECVGRRHRHRGEVDHQCGRRVGVVIDGAPMHERRREGAMR